MPAQKSKPAEAPVHEVDLSDEWASLLEQGATAAPPPPATPPPPPPANKVAPPAPVKAEPATPKEWEISEFEIPVEEPAVEEPTKSSFTGISAELPEISAPEESAEEIIEVVPVEESKVDEPLHAAPQVQPEPEPAQEIVLDQEYELVLTPEEEEEPAVEKAPAKQEKAPEPVGTQVLSSDQFLADLANEIDQLGIGELTPAFTEPEPVQAAPVAQAKAEAPLPAASTEHEPLKEVFDEFRAEFGEMGAEDEDLETHYNLGIAFREMGLLEEAISEFQKVAKANEKGKAFRYAMQCCTLLGLAFMEKGQPSIAAIWYERALRTPGVDAESTLALRYDLGVAQETANDLDAALKSFSQVYAVNIDYRGVADRIAALQKTTR